MITSNDFKSRDMYNMAQYLVENLGGIAPSSGVDIVTKNVTPNMFRATNNDEVTDVKSCSISNVGEANGAVLGAILKPGETVNFAAPLNYTIPTITYNGTGTELLIITVK